jgi:hypothetical protein
MNLFNLTTKDQADRRTLDRSHAHLGRLVLDLEAEGYRFGGQLGQDIALHKRLEQLLDTGGTEET